MEDLLGVQLQLGESDEPVGEGYTRTHTHQGDAAVKSVMSKTGKV